MKDEKNKITNDDKIIKTEEKSKKRKNPLFFGLRWKLRLIVGLVVIVLVGTALIPKILSFKAQPVVQTATFVEQIQNLSSLATAQAHVKAVLQEEDNKIFGKQINTNFPGTKRKVLFIVPSSVMAGIDLSDVTENNINVNDEEKILTIAIPPAKIIGDPVLYVDKIEVFSQEGLFRSEMDLAEGFNFASEANEIVIREATDQGLLKAAEDNAKTVIKQFFEHLGYDVTVNINA